MKEAQPDVRIAFDDFEELPASLEVVAKETTVEAKSPYAGQFLLGGNEL